MNPYVQYMYSYPHKTAYRQLPGISLKEYAHLLAGKGHGLYLHVPFCQKKCGYCNLFSVAGQGREQIECYFHAVERQCRQYEELLRPYGAEFSEVVIGGGTPLYLSEQQLERMFGLVETYFCLDAQREIVVETAPNQTSSSKIAILKQAGVTRVSMGVQSFHDRELAVLGRSHSAEKAREALKRLKDADFPCVNVDFIYGVPGQTVEDLLDSLREALSFEPDEIFLYPLYIKHGVGLEHRGVTPDVQMAYLQYEAASIFLKNAGFRQDSMRRFVRGKHARCFSECGFQASLALGCGGRSYLGNLHFCSPYTTKKKECQKRIVEYENTMDFTMVTHGILLSEEELKRRYLIRHLLIRPGLSLSRYQEYFQSQAMEDFPILENWMEKGFAKLQRQEQYLTLTDTGLGLSDYLGPQLISLQIQKAMEEWEENDGETYDIISR